MQMMVVALTWHARITDPLSLSWVRTVSLSTGDTKDSLSFSQGEADTIMLSVGYSSPVVIDAEDTDMYIHAVAISQAFSALKKEAILFLQRHVYQRLRQMSDTLTGCDANSCFFEHGNNVTMRNCQKVVRPIASSQSVGKAFH